MNNNAAIFSNSFEPGDNKSDDHFTFRRKKCFFFPAVARSFRTFPSTATVRVQAAHQWPTSSIYKFFFPFTSNYVCKNAAGGATMVDCAPCWQRLGALLVVPYVNSIGSGSQPVNPLPDAGRTSKQIKSSLKAIQVAPRVDSWNVVEAPLVERIASILLLPSQWVDWRPSSSY